MPAELLVIMVKTQALVHNAVGQKASIEEVELDEVAGSEVLVRMVATGYVTCLNPVEWDVADVVCERIAGYAIRVSECVRREQNQTFNSLLPSACCHRPQRRKWSLSQPIPKHQ